MRTRWMIVGSLLTLAIIAVTVFIGGRVLAQQGTDEATPKAPAAEESPASPETESKPEPEFHGFHFSMDEDGPGRHIMGMWSGGADWDPMTRLAEIVGLAPDELQEALADGQTLTEIAAANGMTRQELAGALLAEVDELLAEVAEWGLFDQEQIDFVLDWATDGLGLLLDHPLPIGESWWAVGLYDWDRLLDVGDFDLDERLAELLGLTSEELQEAILDGQSLAEIAEANGVEPQAVVDFFTTEAGAKLDEAVAEGYLSEEQAQALRGWIEDGVPLLVDNSFVFPGGLEFLGQRMGPGLGFHMEGMDWGEWPEFEWGEWPEFDWDAFAISDPLDVAAETIGITRKELMDALNEGQSLQEIAEAHGVDWQAVVEAQVKAEVEAATGMFKDLPEGVLPHLDLDVIIEELADLENIEEFMMPGFFFGEGWDEMPKGWTPWGEGEPPWLEHLEDWAPWGEGEPPWLKHFECCPCDEAESGE